MATFADHLATTDAERFVGRAAELGRLEDVLTPEPDRRIVFVHGPGGIGKSTLLRELSRRATAKGFEVLLLDARDLDPVPNELEEAIEPAYAATRPLLILDTWERMASADTALRTRLLPSLPADAVVVIASREPPDAGWFTGGWESLVAEIEVRPMAQREARALVRELGVGAKDAAEIVAWAQGSPLALTVAAGAAQDQEGWHQARPEEDPDILRSLLRRVVEHELEPADSDVAAVTALARRVTPELISAVLEEVDGRAAFNRIARLSFAEPAGSGLRFHDLARRALRAELRIRDPDRERELRRRIADHLHARVLAGEPRLIVDLSELVDNPALRWGFGAEGSPEIRIDAVHPGTAEELREALTARGDAAAVETTLELIEHAPDWVVITRGADDSLAGFSISGSPASAPAAADADPLMGRWLAHARAREDADRTLVWRDSVDLTAGPAGNPASPVLALMNTAAILGSGTPNPRFLYLPINPGNASAVAFAQGVGAQHVPELDYHYGSMVIQCHIFDTGPGGLVGSVVSAVYAELGLEQPAPPEPWVAPIPAGADAESVRAALKSFHRPSELAASPLATGATPDQRVASVRALLEHAIAQAFGDTMDEELARRTLELGYLDSSVTHEGAADELHLSRAAYFRRLRQAVERLAEWILSRPA
ncbi:MAG: hypothetical protein ACJ762_17770 [Solirubrobacteraceae bacterium]